MMILMDSTYKISIVLLLAFTGCALLRRRSAAVRHWLLAGALACAVVMPALASIAPSWQVPFASSVASAFAAAPADHRLRKPEADAVVVAYPVRPSMKAMPAQDRQPQSRTIPIAIVWLAGTVISLCVLMIGLARLARLAARATRVADPIWIETARTIGQTYGLRRPIHLLQLHSDHPALLATWGLFRPTLLLPADALTWTEDRIRIVLCHELAHIRRGDWTTQMVAELVRSIYWFNPLLWIACRRLRHESEQACDDAVLRLGVEGADYAAHVVELARAFRAHRRAAASSPALAMARPSGLERRVRAMLNAQIDRRPVTRWGRLTIVAVLAGVALTIAGINAAGRQTNASFSGSVVDVSGAGISNATIMLTSLETDTGHTITSDQDGHFEITDLPPGHYVLQTSARGFAPLRDTEVDLAPGRHMQRNIMLQLGSLREMIVLTAPTTPGRLPQKLVGAPDPVAESRIKAFRDRDRNVAIDLPMKVTDVKPVYPESAVRDGIEETVIVESTIAVDGSVTNVHALSPMHPELGEAAVEAVRGWRYTPTRLHGVPVETQVTTTIDFRLDR